MSQPTFPPGHPVHAYGPTYTKSPAETKAVQDAAYAAQRASYKAGQDAVAADHAEIAGLNPEITSLSPTTKANGSGAFTLTVNGYDFDNGAVVRWAGTALVTTWMSRSQLTAAVAAGQVTTGTKAITVISAGGKVSNSINFTVT